MMRLNLQLTMGTFSLSLFGLMGVAFGMNLESSLEEVRMYYFNNLGMVFNVLKIISFSWILFCFHYLLDSVSF